MEAVNDFHAGATVHVLGELFECLDFFTLSNAANDKGSIYRLVTRYDLPASVAGALKVTACYGSCS